MFQTYFELTSMVVVLLVSGFARWNNPYVGVFYIMQQIFHKLHGRI